MPRIDFANITKTFAGVTALDGVSLSIAAGECHALMGENGAGKSTLGKVLAGIHRPDSGAVQLDGRSVHFHSPLDAARAGVRMVHQELAYCPDLSVAENLCLGQYPRRLGLFTSRIEMRQRARHQLAQIGIDLDVDLPMRALSTGQVQVVHIAVAVGSGANTIIFDEPTSSLSETEARRLFALIADLRRRGVTMIYVSHRIPEVFELCDRISVLRDGRYVGTLDRATATPDALVRMMIGRSIEEYFPRHLGRPAGPVLLEVHDLSSPGMFANISFNLHAGEIVGLAGLVGSGRSEVARAIFGLDSRATGQVSVEGRPLALGHVGAAMRAGIGLVPEDRKIQGLVPMMSGRGNWSLPTLDRRRLPGVPGGLGLINHSAERRGTIEFFQRLSVRTSSIEAPVAAMSGGNQQKVVLAKWLARRPRVLIVDEPTRGVDVGAKAAIHELIDGLAQSGLAILLISSELPEVIDLSTRLLVMRQGRLVAEVPREQATQDHLMRLMAGVEPGEKQESMESKKA